MANYDNSRFTYAQVLNNEGYYMKDDSLRSSAGVKTMQEKLNKVGFWCGTPDGKFGDGTDEAVRHFQRAEDLGVDGKAGQGTLRVLDYRSAQSPGYSKTSGAYGVYFDNTNKKFLYVQQRVYEALRVAGLNSIAIAGFMGNLEAESGFRTAKSSGAAFGIAQWENPRKRNLQQYAAASSMDVTNAILQAWFIVEECTSGSAYVDPDSVNCMQKLKNGSATTVAKAADCVTALYERCHHHATWSGAQGCTDYDASRYSSTPNAYNNQYYLDASKRRGYAKAYYNCILKM